MKIPPGDAERLCAKPPDTWRAILLYGPDRGLSHERLRTLARAIAGDMDDPFRVSDINATEVSRQPGRLLDEAAQMSLDGGSRVIWIRNADDAIAASIEAFLKSGIREARILIEAGDLRPQSKLRKIFERAKDGAAIASYADDSRTLSRMIDAAIAESGITIDRDARMFLVERLGRDRGVSRSELEKIILYAGPGGKINYEETLTLTGDNALLGMNELADAAGLGKTNDAFRALARLEEEGQQPVGIVRGLLRHFQRLHAVTSTADVARAVEGLRPPVHFRRKDGFRRQAQRWDAERVERALASLGRAEILCKRSGIPDRTVLRETVLGIARIAP